MGRHSLLPLAPAQVNGPTSWISHPPTCPPLAHGLITLSSIQVYNTVLVPIPERLRLKTFLPVTSLFFNPWHSRSSSPSSAALPSPTSFPLCPRAFFFRLSSPLFPAPSYPLASAGLPVVPWVSLPLSVFLTCVVYLLFSLYSHLRARCSSPLFSVSLVSCFFCSVAPYYLFLLSPP